MKRSGWMARGLAGAMVLAWAAGCATVPRFERTGSQPADWVLVNARILTSHAEQPRAEALAVAGERIAYVGDRRGVADFVGPETEVVDGRGRLVTPGFVDNHCHVLWIGGMAHLQPPELFACETQEEVLAWVKARAAEHPDLPLIGGIGWRMNQLPEGPRREILDAAVPDRPVMLMSYSGQGGWLNSRAIERMESRNPEAFERLAPVRDPETGRATGECKHYHVINYLDYWTWEELGPAVEEGVLAAMGETIDMALSFGVTTMHDIQIYPQFIPMILKFRDRGGLEKARVRGAYFIGHERLADEAALKKDLREWKKLRRTESGPHLVLGESVKLYIDGTADNHTKFLREPYSDDPTTHGRADWTAEEFNRVVAIVDKLGLQACTHACGDAGAVRVIDAVEHALEKNGMRDARHSIEHCEMAPPEDWPRMARLGIYASMQPQHFFGDEMVETQHRARAPAMADGVAVDGGGGRADFVRHGLGGGPVQPGLRAVRGRHAHELQGPGRLGAAGDRADRDGHPPLDDRVGAEPVHGGRGGIAGAGQVRRSGGVQHRSAQDADAVVPADARDRAGDAGWFRGPDDGGRQGRL
jgi:predicted amidohydrolase YtcJ